MRRISSITLAIVLTALVARDGAAQWNVAHLGPARNRVYTSFGLDPAFITSLGYGRVVSVMRHKFEFIGDVGVVAADMDARDSRVRLGTQTSVVHWRSLHLTASAMGLARSTQNNIYRGYNFGADITGALGVYRPRWFAAGEFGKDKAVITHVTHTDWYRAFYPDAKDGWYLDAGGTFHYGVAAGLALGKTEVVGRFGFLETEDFNEIAPPMHASVAVGYRF